MVARKKYTEATVEITRHTDTSIGRRKIGEQVVLSCDEAAELVNKRVAKYVVKPVEIVEPIEDEDAS